MLKRLALCFVVFGLAAMAADFAGKWQFSVDLDTGAHGDPVFVLVQQKDGKLTGTYNGPLGEQNVTGTVTGSKAVFGFEFERDGTSVKATYTGTLEGAKLTGVVEMGSGDNVVKGKWTAMKK